MDNLVDMCDEVIESYFEETKTVSANFKKKNITCKTQNVYKRDPNNIKTDEKSYKNIFIYYIGNVTIKIRQN